MSNEMTTYDGFDDDDDGQGGRVIKGIKFGFNNSVWTPPPPGPLLVTHTGSIVQKWKDKKPEQTIWKERGKPLPDLDELNESVPQSEWREGIDGKLQGPWQFQEVVYLLDPDTAGKFTFANGAVGTKIAVSQLRDQVRSMRALRGENVVPLVELSDAPMPTKFGMRRRPEFKVIRWFQFGQHDQPTPQLPAPAGITPIEPPTLAEEMNDGIPFLG
jgi:hypothetical protein